jgi:hypothetical protein
VHSLTLRQLWLHDELVAVEASSLLTSLSRQRAARARLAAAVEPGSDATAALAHAAHALTSFCDAELMGTLIDRVTGRLARYVVAGTTRLCADLRDQAGAQWVSLVCVTCARCRVRC